ncbi:MAG: hypothetical protein ACPGSD_09665 [Flavobacteriales bacterium]
MKIIDSDQFQPSNEALNLWLTCRKKVKHLNGNNIAPLFSDSDYTSDTSWYYITWALELLGFIATLYGGLRSGGVWAILALALVIFFIIIDFLLIVPALHKNVKTKVYNAALIQILNKKRDLVKIRSLQDEMKKGKITFAFAVAGLIIMAIVKTAAIILLGTFDSMIFYITFLVLFLAIVYGHVYKTRYKMAYSKTQRKIDKDYENFKDINFQYPEINVNNEPFVTKTPLRINSDKEGIVQSYANHFIKVVSESSENNHYELHTKGILTDDELIQLTDSQNEKNRLRIFVTGRKMQLNNYGLEGKSAESNHVSADFGNIEDDIDNLDNISDEENGEEELDLNNE